MKKNAVCILVALVSVFGCLSPALADLGLAGIAAGDNGGPAVGRAVLAAAKAVYANNTDPAVIQQKLIEILNEAAAIGDETAVRYALVAIMLAGGPDTLEQSIAAINNSNCFSQYETLTANVVGAVASLSSSSGTATASGTATVSGQQTGGSQQMFGGQGVGTLLQALGVNPDNPFTWSSLTGSGDNDLPSTRV
jgi:hypothetical protein